MGVRGLELQENDGHPSDVFGKAVKRTTGRRNVLEPVYDLGRILGQSADGNFIGV